MRRAYIIKGSTDVKETTKLILNNKTNVGTIVVVIIWSLDVQLPMPITTKVVGSNPAQCEVYNIM
jgi:hypothetical protein